MRKFPIPTGETKRLHALAEYEIMDSPPEAEFDELTRLASYICQVPLAQISLVDDRRQWFKSRLGFDLTETPREASFCQYALMQRDVVEVEDASQDERFADSPLVLGDPHVRFYAGAPLITPGDHALGALCVMDREPRKLSADQRDALQILARQVMTRLELSRQQRQLQTVTDHAPVGIALYDRDRRYIFANPAYAEMMGKRLSEIIGHSAPEVMGKFYDEVVRPRLDLAFTGQRVAFEGKKRMADGERYFEAIQQPRIVNGEVLQVVSVVLDVTERQRVAAALRAKEEQFNAADRRLAAIVASSDDAIIGKTLDSIITSWNKGSERIFGYAAAEVIGKPINLLIPEDRQHEEEVIIEKIQRGESVKHFETRRKRKDGRLIDVSVTASPIKDEKGNVIGASKVARDITSQKEAEASLRLFRSLMDESNDTIEVIDPETGRFLDVNAKGPTELGYSREEYLTLRLFDVETTLDEARWFDLKAELKTAGSMTGEGEHRRKDGSLFPVEFSAKWVRLDRDYVVAIVRDITDRRKTEAAARESREKLAAALASMTDAVFISDADGRFVEFNDAFVTFHRFRSREECLTHLSAYPEILEVSLPDGTVAPLEEWAIPRALEGETAVNAEYSLRRKDTGETWVGSYSFAPIRDPAGTIVGSVVVARDISEHKKLEQQFLRAQRMESLGALAGGIAHDLNNVLGPIMLSLDLLSDKVIDADGAKLLNILADSAQRGANMVRQILSFARGVSGSRLLVQVRHLIEEMAEIANDTFLKHVEIKTSVPSDIWTIVGDPTQLHQVLLNLCVNARDAMADGGTLTLSGENVQVDANYAAFAPEAKPGPYVMIEVEDTGTGIPQETLDKIFDPFFTTKELGKGTGLGLSTTLGIVKSHGGFLRVYSEPGQGTKFKIYLPADTEASAGASNEPEAEMPHGNGELVLVVDDEAAVRQITRQTLEAYGYRVLLASDGAEAVAIFGEHHHEIDVVLTDMMMPIMDGPATIQVLRRIKPTIPIIAASGLSTSEHVSRATRLDIQHFLPKPYTARTLLTVLGGIRPRE
ncbi:MAG TPA: PAS domain S-box protein [Chthoniobacterales bacterium]